MRPWDNAYTYSNTLRGLAFAAMIAVAAPLVPAAVTPAEAACVINVVPGDRLNMRSAPRASASIVRRIPRKSCDVRLTGRYSGNWGRVRYGGATGWVNMRFIDEGGDEGGAIPARYCVNAPGDSLNFRTRPNARSPVVGAAIHGFCGLTLLTCASGRNWCKMRTHEFDGWVNMRYVRAR